jgi:hypothetical protein
MIILDTLWRTVLLPGGLALTLALAAWALLLRDPKSSREALTPLLGTAAVLAGTLVAFLVQGAFPDRFPPAQSWQWIPCLTLLALPLAALESLGHRLPALLRWAARVLFLLLALALTFLPLAPRGSLKGFELAPVAALIIGALTQWPWSRASGNSAFPGYFLAGALAAWTGTAAAVFLFESVRLGQLAGALAAAIGALLIPSALNPAAGRFPRVISAWLCTLLPVLAALVYWSGDSTNIAGFLVLGAAPLALLLWPKTGATSRRITALAVFALLLLTAVGLTAQNFFQAKAAAKDDPYADYYNL